MKHRKLVSCLLSVALFVSMLPAAGAVEPTTEDMIPNQMEEQPIWSTGRPENGYHITTIDQLPEGTVLSEAILTDTPADIGNRQMMENTVTGFTTYGDQLKNMVFTSYDGKYSAKMGNIMKKLYDNAKADIAKGTSSILLINDPSTLKNIGVSFKLPNIPKNEWYSFADMAGWAASRALIYDCPEMFYSNIFEPTGYTIIGDTITIWFYPHFFSGLDTRAKRIQYQKKLDTKLTEIINEAKQYPRAYDKIKFFHDWLCAHNTYNDILNIDHNVIGSIPDELPWSPISAILSDSDSAVSDPICEGYARAFQLLCNKAGIRSTVVSSYKDFHMWNNVQYGQKWTGVDVTWDDTGRKPIVYDWFFQPINNLQGHRICEEQFDDYFSYPKLTAVSVKNDLPFYDISTTFWGRSAVQSVYDNNYMDGMTCVAFQPSNYLTREQFAQILYNINGKPKVTYTKRFTDVPEGRWYTNAVLWAAEKGYVQGYPDKSFGIGKSIRRQDIVLILYRSEGSPAVKDMNLEQRFHDAKTISSYAYQAVSWAVSKSVINGDNKGNLTPTNSATRIQAAVIISNYFK